MVPVQEVDEDILEVELVDGEAAQREAEPAHEGRKFALRRVHVVAGDEQSAALARLRRTDPGLSLIHI